ncbi:MAG: hypothetical protein COU47_00235 [Candidatus Niyogibacteria bacterium CG10_big_fil_rev_8_21_14_0_10_46_36]|uniref:Type II secretion system protein GspG C-terminal domain-containing protein n=1 Tax=Candidatus Niyogibacteria bacterium CG10_big_fil_rev_8_21_14_0_10_46_36 TaxID=1974726 RepID=A0A2H0TFX7_9BACT|nr:MAG: hypothetical protein COU47_00235 [Candidatus Niyogibacteria bacterium CG10_big_fil_rev_8_21_14_0_10_46_36]
MDKRGFTLVELLVVIAIIGILASVVLASVASARARGRDARRLSDMKQIQIALELYYGDNAAYPGNTDNDCGGWDAGFNGGQGSGDAFVTPLETAGAIVDTPGDPVGTSNCGGYAYFRYNAGSYGCDAGRGAYFVLGVRDMETSAGAHPDSPGWSCPSRDWQAEFDWVTGKFER